MTVIAALIPVSLGLGLLGLAAFVWSLKARQYDDLRATSTGHCSRQRRRAP